MQCDAFCFLNQSKAGLLKVDMGFKCAIRTQNTHEVEPKIL